MSFLQLESFQRSATKMGQGLEGKVYEEQPCFVQPRAEELRGGLMEAAAGSGGAALSSALCDSDRT